VAVCLLRMEEAGGVSELQEGMTCLGGRLRAAKLEELPSKSVGVAVSAHRVYGEQQVRLRGRGGKSEPGHRVLQLRLDRVRRGAQLGGDLRYPRTVRAVLEHLLLAWAQLVYLRQRDCASRHRDSWPGRAGFPDLQAPQAGINALPAEHSEIGGVLLLSHPMLG
jgi:hypothetical protein